MIDSFSSSESLLLQALLLSLLLLLLSLSTIKLTPPSDDCGLLRKKLGELVKSSLKLPNLARSVSSPGMLSPNKSVRFASRLANVKMFDGNDSPSTVATAENTPLGSPHHEEMDSYFQLNWNDEETSSEEENDVVHPYQMISSDVTGGDKNKVVNLKEVYLVEDELIGKIMVENIAFEKKISIKLTFNNWKTKIIINNHINFVKSINNFDEFEFKIDLSNLPCHINLEMVVKYEVNNQVYWDNNFNQNYHIKLSTNQNYNNNQFDDLINKLNDYKNNHELDYKLANTNPKSELHHRYNLSNELNTPRSPLSRPLKYSNSYKSKQSTTTSFNSKSYSDLLQSYCFYGAPEKNSFNSTASTFHSLSDSIHI